MEKLTLEGYNNLKINAYLYTPTSKPKAVIQIIHGMQEHALRYKEFSEFLCSQGYVVLASDSRGHGFTSLSKDKLGYDDGDIFANTVQDQLLISKYLKEKFDNLPLFIFGHSYGSFITQKLLQVNPYVKKYVICGTADGDSFIFKLGNFVASILSFLGLKNHKATLIENLSIKAYGKKFEGGNWLTRDEVVYKEFTEDEYCGGSFPISFYKSMFSNLIKVNKGIKNIPKDIKVLFIVGDKDPVGDDSKQVKTLFGKFIKNGINADLEIYKDCRHELVAELNKEEIFNDVLRFYKEK